MFNEIKPVAEFSAFEKCFVALTLEAKKRLLAEIEADNHNCGQDGRVVRRWRQLRKFYFALPLSVRNAVADAVDFAGLSVEIDDHVEYLATRAFLLAELSKALSV